MNTAARNLTKLCCSAVLLVGGLALAQLSDKDKMRVRGMVNVGKSELKTAVELNEMGLKLVKGKGKYDLLDAGKLLSGAGTAANKAAHNLRLAVRTDPSLAEEEGEVGGKKAKLPELIVLAEALQKESFAELEKHTAAIAAKEKAWKSEAQSGAVGERAGVVKKHGLPTWWDGLHNRPAENLAAFKKAAWYRYDRSDGCSFTYHFKGTKLTRTEPNRPGCKH